MQSRLVTVTLTVALGLFTGSMAWSQSEETLDPVDLGPIFENPVSSELPLGELGPGIEESLAQGPAPDLSSVERQDEWLYSARRAFSRTPWSRVAVIGFAAGIMLLVGWAMASVLRRRRRRGYHRLPMPKGETRQQRLEEVVASVQFPDRPLTADLRYLDEGMQSEARSANPSVGTRPTGVEIPIDR